MPADPPRPGHLQMMLPWVTNAEGGSTMSSAFDGLHIMTIAPDTEYSIEVRVSSDEPPNDLRNPPRDAVTVAVSICDPFSFGDGSPALVTATVTTAEGGDRSLVLPLSDRWTISLSTGPEQTSSITIEDLVSVVSGMAWPSPIPSPPPAAGGPEETGGEGAGGPEKEEPPTARPDMPCPPDPEIAIEVGSFTLTAVPDGFEPMLPVEYEESGPVDMGGESTATLTLSHPDGRRIQVTTFGAASPSDYILRSLGGAAPDNVNVRRCVRTSEGWERLDNLAVVGTSGGSTMLAAQEWEYEGYLVIGLAGTDRADLVTVAEGLRFNRG